MDQAATPEDYRAAGLYDPDDEHAATKLELLEFLSGVGVTIEEMVAGADRLPTLGSRAWLGNEPRYTRDEVVARTGIDPELISALWRAIGFVDPENRAIFREADMEALELFRLGSAIVGEDHAMQFARVLGNSLARIAETTVSFFVTDVGRASIQRDPVGLDLARANAMYGALLPQLETSMNTILRHFLEQRQRTVKDIDRPGMPYDELPFAVGFVDLVDSTVLARTLDPAALGRALTSFEATMTDLASSHGGRVVKHIGDEAMFVCAEAGAACAIALRAAEEFREHALLPQVRCGVAYGDVLLREGDYFGPVVNLAARAVKLARPGSVLVTDALAEVLAAIPLDAPIAVGVAAQHQVKGFDEPIVLHEITPG